MPNYPEAGTTNTKVLLRQEQPGNDPFKKRKLKFSKQ